MPEPLSECDGLTGRKRLICRGEAGLPLDGPHSVNAYRAAWGLPPLQRVSAPVGSSQSVQRPARAVKRRLPVADEIPCPFRGAIVSTREADLCGLRGTEYGVYSCSIHGECVLSRACRRQPEHVCATCEDRP